MYASAQRKWIQTIHIAKKQTGVSDEQYRAILTGCAGVDSSKEITRWEDYNAVMKAFKTLGFHSVKKTVDDKERNPEWISAKQEKYIRGLWELASRQKDEKALQAFVKRITGSDSLTWLHKKDASKVIIALRQMANDAGFNPDRKPE